VSGDPRVLGLVLAGGAGKRLAPLTADRAKPAVPFGGQYRLVDFVLSNLVNAGYHRLCVLTQYKSHSLDRHITTTWRLSTILGEYVTAVPAQQRLGPRWYDGSADAIYQSLNLVYDDEPDIVVVFGADHVYRMDPRQMVQQHIESGAGVTVAGLRVPRSEAGGFGIIETGPDGQSISQFLEKPEDPPCVPGSPDECFASMGNYVFSTDVLLEAVKLDADDESSLHDMGGDIVPMLVKQGIAQVYDFSTNEVPGETPRDHGYWRWPLLTGHTGLPPAKVVYGGSVKDSMLSNGVIVSGGRVQRSVVSPAARISEGARVENSVLLHGVEIGPGAIVRNCILDKNVKIGPGVRLGGDREADEARGATVSDGGITVLGKAQRLT